MFGMKELFFLYLLFRGIIMRVAIVEDEKKWQAVISNKIRDYFKVDVEIVYYDSGEKFLEECVEYEIIFMDIELKAKDGFITSMEYKKRYPDSIIIILTTHNELCNRGYQVDAFRYLDKLKLEEMKEALDGACKRLNSNQKISLHVVLTGEVEIAYKDILYFETKGHNICVHTLKETFECKENITVLAEQLKENGFYYIHRSFLINMDYVINFNRKEVIMSNGDLVLVSLRKLADFKKKFTSWRFERGNG